MWAGARRIPLTKSEPCDLIIGSIGDWLIPGVCKEAQINKDINMMPYVSAGWGVLGQGIYGAEDYGMSIALHMQCIYNG